MGPVGGQFIFEGFDFVCKRPDKAAAVPDGEADGSCQGHGKGPEQGEDKPKLPIKLRVHVVVQTLDSAGSYPPGVGLPPLVCLAQWGQLLLLAEMIRQPGRTRGRDESHLTLVRYVHLNDIAEDAPCGTISEPMRDPPSPS